MSEIEDGAAEWKNKRTNTHHRSRRLYQGYTYQVYTYDDAYKQKKIYTQTIFDQCFSIIVR